MPETQRKQPSNGGLSGPSHGGPERRQFLQCMLILCSLAHASVCSWPLKNQAWCSDAGTEELHDHPVPDHP
eukprot:scaffold26325_cov19-Tisochrysis_lutea.AAC.1